VPGPPRISVAELAAGAADSPLLDDSGQPSGPLLAVDLSNGAASNPTDEQSAVILRRAAARATCCPRLLIGLAAGPLPPAADELLRALDLTFIPASAATSLASAPASATSPASAAAPATPAPATALTGRDEPDRHCVPVPDTEAALAALDEAIAANPRAALVLRQVLRATEELPVREALDVESLAYSVLLGGTEFGRWRTERPPRGLPPQVTEPVLVRREHQGGEDRLLITLNRPERRNAYGRQLRDALADALRVAVLDPAVDRVLLDGAGPSFSAGGDLGEFGTAPDPVTAHFVRTQGGAALLLHALRDRAEVHQHGPCVGAGVELPAFAGWVTADPRTTFTLPEVRMGLIPGAGGTVSIPRRIGRWRTLYLALGGLPLDAATALAWGLVDRLDPPGL
jgi:enoyl-CoA hydratase/carnithine racemase